MRRLPSRPALAILAALLVAGCLGGAAPAGDAPAAGGTAVDSDRPEPTFTDLSAEELGGVAPPDAAATLAVAPTLVEGEWWRIEMTDAFLGQTTEFVRVVARVEPDLYVFGMPHAGWWKEAIIYHTPAFGDVNRDLSHRAHDVPFVPLRFPLEDGATWQTSWESEEPVLTATVKVESPTTARITFTGTSCGVFGFVGQCPSPTEGTVVELLYDASVHEVVEASFPSHTWRVVEHGTGFEGWVTVPRAERLVFLHGRVGTSAIGFPTPAASLPTDTIGVEGGFNRVSFILGAGNVPGVPAGGAYSEKATAPDGTVFEVRQVPGGPFTIEFFEQADPDGDWFLEHLVAGPGAAFAEGIAYHQYDIEVPTGRIRSDHSHEVVR